jgi:glycosyltransferase involved in cell wall biosynthesis
MPTLMEEAFGLTVAEAMACGKPVVASHVGGIPTIVSDHEMLVRPGNVEELSRKATKILADESLATRLGRQARETICARFTLSHMVEDTARIFEGCVRSGK